MGRIGYMPELSITYKVSDIKMLIERCMDAGDIKGASALYGLFCRPFTEEEFDICRVRFESKDGGMNLL